MASSSASAASTGATSATPSATTADAASTAAAAPAPRLSPMAWWRSLGSPVNIAAPMVNASELPFRMLCRQYGAQLCYTPMLHARLSVESKKYLSDNFHTAPGDRPLFAQFCGNDPAILVAAARKIQHAVDAVDLNLGCPQNIARRGKYGAFLLEQTDLLVSIVTAMAAGLDVPVTCKIRILPTEAATLALVLALQGAGASLITIHGRPRDNMKETITAVDWAAIRRIKAHPEVVIPIVANGGVACFDDVAACVAATGADGVMSSEALLENPGLFSNRQPRAAVGSSSGGGSNCEEGGGEGGAAASASASSLPGGTAAGRPQHDSFDMALGYLDAAETYPGADVGIVRAHLMKILFSVWELLPAYRDQLVRRGPEVGSLPAMRAVVLAAREAWAAHPPAVWSARLCASALERRQHQLKAAAARGQQQQQRAGAADAAPLPAPLQLSAVTTSPAAAVPSADSPGAAAAAPLPSFPALPPALASASHSDLAVLAAQRVAASVAVWAQRRAEEPTAGLSHPEFVGDPALPGLWYMRYRRAELGGAFVEPGEGEGSSNSSSSSYVILPPSAGADSVAAPTAAAGVGDARSADAAEWDGGACGPCGGSASNNGETGRNNIEPHPPLKRTAAAAAASAAASEISSAGRETSTASGTMPDLDAMEDHDGRGDASGTQTGVKRFRIDRAVS